MSAEASAEANAEDDADDEGDVDIEGRLTGFRSVKGSSGQHIKRRSANSKLFKAYPLYEKGMPEKEVAIAFESSSDTDDAPIIQAPKAKAAVEGKMGAASKFLARIPNIELDDDDSLAKHSHYEVMSQLAIGKREDRL